MACTGAKKNKSVVLIAHNDALVVLIEHRSILQGFGDLCMYTLRPPFLYPEAALRGTCLRSALERLSPLAAHPKGALCLEVFALVTFPPPPVTSPATRL